MLDKLLLVGVLSSEDIDQMLMMVHPETWDPTFDKGVHFYSTKDHLALADNFFAFSWQGQTSQRHYPNEDPRGSETADLLPTSPPVRCPIEAQDRIHRSILSRLYGRPAE